MQRRSLAGPRWRRAQVRRQPVGCIGPPGSGAVVPPGPGQDPVKVFLAGTFAARALAQWCQFLEPLDVCWAPVKTLTEAFSDPHTRERGMVWTAPDGGKHLGIPIRFANEPGRIDPRLDVLGGSTAA